MANHTSTIDKVIEYLTNSFDPAAAGEIDARIEIRMREESIYFVIQDKKMRMGEQECQLNCDSMTYEIYGKDSIHERHRHRYEVNDTYISKLEASGLRVAGRSRDHSLVEVIELSLIHI